MRGWFGIGIESPKREFNTGTLYRSAYCLGAHYIFTIGRRYHHTLGDTTKSWRNIPAFSFTDAQDFLSHRPFSGQLIAVERTPDAVPLESFRHPERAIYVLGPEDGSISTEIMEACQAVVSIQTKQCLNVAMAGVAVLYDRHQKGWTA